jgi:uncharacterized protein DUF3485
MPRFLAVAVALALLMICGVVHGWWADRWQKSAALEDACAKVPLAPMAFGDWQAQEIESEAAAFAQAGAQSYWTRQYTNARTRQTVLAILMCGRAGRMAVHTPEVCYRGAGFELYDAPAPTPLRSGAGEVLGTFLTARFAKSTSLGGDLRLYWAWNAGDGWQAPGSPRWAFRGRPFLYKLYVSHDLTSGSDQDAAADLLRHLLPELRATLFPDEG